MIFIYLGMLGTEEEKRKFEKIYLKYRQAMFYTAKSILKDDALAEDAVQEAFLRIIDNLNKIDENNCHKTKGFIVVVVEHIAIDIYRKRNKTKFVSIDELENPLEDVKEYEIDGENLIEKSILSLPTIYQTVLLLKFLNGYEDGELARILKISQANVRQRLSRGKKQLAEILKKEGITL